MTIHNIKRELPKSVLYGILTGNIWILVVMALWVSLGMYNSSYYKFGPSDTMILAFTNIAINTWPKYIGIVFYIIFSCFMTVISGDWVYPWINAVVMNPEATLQTHKSYAYAVVNYFWFINSLYNIFFFALTYTQVDLALFTIGGSCIGGLISSYFIIFDKDRIVVPKPAEYDLYDKL